MTVPTKRKILTLCLLCQPPRILLGMKKRGFGANLWNGFGGKIEAGETIEEGARREFYEEAGITIGDLHEQGLLEFEFEGSDELLEVHVFKASDYTGEPTESEEMKPQWFDISEIPFDKMWQDDEYWFSLLLEGKKFTGKFLFDANDNMLSHDIKVL